MQASPRQTSCSEPNFFYLLYIFPRVESLRLHPCISGRRAQHRGPSLLLPLDCRPDRLGSILRSVWPLFLDADKISLHISDVVPGWDRATGYALQEAEAGCHQVHTSHVATRGPRIVIGRRQGYAARPRSAGGLEVPPEGCPRWPRCPLTSGVLSGGSFCLS